MPPVTARKWEYFIVGVVLFVAVYLLFVPPIVGEADNGDYYRLSARAGLASPPGLTFDDQYSCWLLVHWNVVPARPLYGFSTGEFPVWIATNLFINLSKATTLDIRWVAGVHLAFLLLMILIILRSSRRLPMTAYFVVAAGLVLVGTDSGYISYFNSFYGESAALLGVFAYVAAGLATVMADDLSWRHLSAITLAGAFLAGSKAQNAILGLFAACWLVWLFWGKPAQRYTSVAVGLALVCFSGFVVTRAPAPDSNLFNAIYDRLLPNSEDPLRSLAELGLKPETAFWIGKTYWEVKPESADVYPGKATRLTLLEFYLRHPFVDLRMAQEALTLNNDVPYIGNYPKESGEPCRTRTRALTGYERLRMKLASIWFVFPLLAANMAAVFLWRNRPASLISMLGIMAAVAFLPGSFYDNEPRKHLFTFNLLFDMVLFADLAVAAVLVSRRRSGYTDLREEVVRKTGKTVALLLLLVLALAQAGSFSVANLAIGKPATQSSAVSGYGASGGTGAVDGNTDGNFYNGSVTHTNREANPWWQVDLGASTRIRSIVIWNRTDCCSDRLSDYWVFVSDTPFRATDTPATLKSRPGTWSSHQTAAPRPSTRIAPTGAPGRYIRVQLSGTNYLSLAEVQVFGQ